MNIWEKATTTRFTSLGFLEVCLDGIKTIASDGICEVAEVVDEIVTRSWTKTVRIP